MPELKSILESTQSYASSIFTEEVDAKFVYHDLVHTESVAAATIEIAEQSNLSEEEIQPVTIAAWLHDIGYKQGHENHEEASIKMAENYLSEQKLSVDKIEHVKNCIAATRMPQSPKNLMQEVLCDADLYHLSTDKFTTHGEKLKEEWATTNQRTLNEEEWVDINIQFLKGHNYFTNYGKIIL